MQSPNKLFLKFKNDSKFHVIDKNNNSIGSAYDIPDAIKAARKVSNAPIDIGNSYEGFTRICVPEKPDHAIADTRQFITALAEIAGMEVIEHYDNNVNFLGYTMEPIEEDDFLKAELAEEKAIEEILNSFDCYFEEEA